MSTDRTIHKCGDREVVITESSAHYSLDLYDYPKGEDTSGPQNMTAEESLNLAAGIIYTVWCSYQDQANNLVDSMAGDRIPNMWNQLARAILAKEGGKHTEEIT